MTEQFTPARFAIFVEGEEKGKPFRFRIGNTATAEKARELIQDNERAISGTAWIIGDPRPNPSRRYRIFEATAWTERQI